MLFGMKSQSGEYGKTSSMGKKSGLSKKRIFVTGGTGFIGGHLVEELLSYGTTIVVP